MDKLLLKKMALQSVALMIAVITLSYALRQHSSHTLVLASDIGSAEAASIDSEEELKPYPVEEITGPSLPEDIRPDEDGEEKEEAGLPGMLDDIDMEIVRQLGEKLIIIKKPMSGHITMELQDIYINKSIKLTFNSSEPYRMKAEDIGRINLQDTYIGMPVFTEIEEVVSNLDGSTKTVVARDYGKDIVHGISFSNQEIESNIVELTLELDTVYAHSILEDELYYYIGLKKPSEVYDKIIVLDAGHGGKDAGALSKDESVYEKNVNLAILLEVKELLDKENIKVYYTRLGDDKVFLRPRVELANAVDCDYFISIHCNASGSTKPGGTEIFYYGTDFKQVSTKALATIFSEEIEKATSLRNRGLVSLKKDDVFILNHSQVPAVLIETGYMTNLKDLEYMNQKVNQKAIARGIYNGILRAYDELPPIDNN